MLLRQVVRSLGGNGFLPFLCYLKRLVRKCESCQPPKENTRGTSAAEWIEAGGKIVEGTLEIKFKSLQDDPQYTSQSNLSSHDTNERKDEGRRRNH